MILIMNNHYEWLEFFWLPVIIINGEKFVWLPLIDINDEAFLWWHSTIVINITDN